MFFQKDYILRMIELMGALMRHISEMLDDMGRNRELSDACLLHCGMDLQAAEKLSLESLTELLAPIPRLMLSEILYIKAMQTSLPKEEQQMLLYRSAKLLMTLREESLLCEMRKDQLDFCLKEARELFTPQDLLEAAEFFFEGEAFGRGEDMLFDALALAGGTAGYTSLLIQAKALLSRCLSVPAQRLTAGGLPRPEVLEGLTALERRLAAL